MKEALQSPSKLSVFKSKVANRTLGTMIPLIDKGLGDVSKLVEVLAEESRALFIGFEDNVEKLALKVQTLTDGFRS